MKTRYYVYIVFIVIVVILVAVLNNSQPAEYSQATPAVNIPKPAAQPAKIPAKTTVAPQTVQPAAQYYPIHVISADVPIYYSSTDADQISVNNPPINSSVSSPLTVTGVARGTWYFEGTAPILLTDAKGKIIGMGTIRAQSSWMTNEFVPFIGTLVFNNPGTASAGVLVLKNDNPSGLAANAKAVEIMVRFK